jgi:hypothetical protein
MPTQKPQRFKICFSFNHNGILRTKEKIIEAQNIGQAYEKLKAMFGKIHVNRFEVL